MNRLQAIAHIRQGAPDNHAHGVIEVRLAQLFFDIDWQNFFGDLSHKSGFPSTSHKNIAYFQRNLFSVQLFFRTKKRTSPSYLQPACSAKTKRDISADLGLKPTAKKAAKRRQKDGS